MKFLPLLFVGLLCTTDILAEQPAELPVSSSEASFLGVTFLQPEPGTDSIVLQASATVVLPPANEQSANSLYAGFVSRLLVGTGDTVTQGQLLAEVHSVEFLELQRELLGALAEAQLSADQLHRDEALFTEGIVAQRRLDETTARARLARMHVSELRQVLQLAGLDQAAVQALIEDGALQSSLPVLAPINGVVLERFVSTGEPVTASAPIYRLADMSTLWLDIRVNQADIGSITRGQTFQVTAPVAVRGRITAIGSQVDPHTQTVSVRGILDTAEDQALLPDQFVQVQIFALATPSQGDAALPPSVCVPSRALVRHENRTYVFVRRSGAIAVQPVTVSGYRDSQVNIASGLVLEDEVAVSGVAALKALWLGSEAE